MWESTAKQVEDVTENSKKSKGMLNKESGETKIKRMSKNKTREGEYEI